MKRSELMDNPPAEAVAPYTFLRGDSTSEIRLLDANGSVWFNFNDDPYSFWSADDSVEGAYWCKSKVKNWTVANFTSKGWTVL